MSDSSTPHSPAALAAAALDAARTAKRLPRCLVGFDGFIDAIYDAVDRRRDMTPGGYERIATIPAFAARIAGAAGRSANVELVLREERFGGNGPLMAGALARLGCPVTFMGAVGGIDDVRVLHPAYAPFAALCRSVVPIAPTARTDALEFEDGKVMFNHPANVQQVSWERLVETVGLEAFTAAVAEADVLGITNWTIVGGVEAIWDGLIREVLPRVNCTKKRVFIDLSDPAKRTDVDLRRALKMLGCMNGLIRVTLGLNRSEAERIARTLSIAPSAAGGLEVLAPSIRAATGLSCVVVHERRGAAAATGDQSRAVAAQFTERPVISTGAGDHFNAGFALGQSLGLPLEQCLAAGCGVAGAHIRGLDITAWSAPTA